MVALSTSAPSLVEQAIALAHQHHVSLPLEQQPGTFLRLLWQALRHDSLVGLVGQVEYYKAGSWRNTMASQWAYLDEFRRDTGSLLEWAHVINKKPAQLPGMGSIYYNAASRKRTVLARYNARGGLDELTAVAALWCDFDAAKRGYTLEQGMQILLRMPLPPTFVIFTGGGLQAVHVLSEAWGIPDRASAHEYKEHSISFYKPHFERAGLELDRSVHEASREMRLPGFVNKKPERAGAIARIVYYDETATYSIEQIKQEAPLPPPKPRLYLPTKPREAGEAYKVTQMFVYHLIDDPVTVPPERHPTLRSLAFEAARAGMDQEAFLSRLRPVAEHWFAAEPHRAGDELTNLVAWAYSSVAESQELALMPLFMQDVILTESGFARATLDVTQAEQMIEIPAPPEPSQKQDVDTLALEALRADQQRQIEAYLAAKLPRGIGTYLQLATSPGAGKTHATYQAIYRHAMQAFEAGAEKGTAALLTLFKFDATTWPDYVAQFGIDPEHCQYIVARNGDPESDGYCQLHAQAESVARKGWRVIPTLCQRCPLQIQCERDWYLSQFERAKNKPIVLARHHHGLIEALVGYRKLICFDESPLNIVGEPSRLKVEDLTFNGGSFFMQDQFGEQLALLGRFVDSVRSIIAGNPRPPKGEKGSPPAYATLDHIKLGGRAFFEQLESRLGQAALETLTKLEGKLVKESHQAALADLELDSITRMPVNYLYDLWRVVVYEYETYYRAGVQRWNSRIILLGDELRLYPMEPFGFTGNTKIIVTDATGQPELYQAALADSKGRPRQAMTYAPQLEHRCHITQFVGSKNTRSTMLRKRRGDPVTIQTADGKDHTIDPNDIDTAAVTQAKQMIVALAVQHNKSLLVISYKEAVATKLEKWVKQSNVLPVDQVQWFGNLRGKNDYKDLEAVLVVGTPYIQPMDLLALCQAWHWQDPLPIDSTQKVYVGAEALPYPGYVGPDGYGRAYQYIGYADQRVNQMFLHLVQAELRQCYERIRPNASEGERYVYLATDMPCSDQVDEIKPWATWQVDHVAERAIDDFRKVTGRDPLVSEMVPLISEKADCHTNTARAAAQRILGNATPGQRVRDWLAEDPRRAEWSISMISDTLAISEPTIKRERQKFKARIKNTKSPNRSL